MSYPNIRLEERLKRKLNEIMCTILEGSIDAAIGRKEGSRTEAEQRLERIQYDEQVATADLVALVRSLLDIQRAADSITADRWSLAKR